MLLAAKRMHQDALKIVHKSLLRLSAEYGIESLAVFMEEP